MVAATVPASARTARSIDTVHEPVASSPARIRRRLRAVFAQWGLPDATAEDALMVVEELVANAVDHARTPFRLTVDQLPAGLRITVRDECAEPPDVRPFAAHAPRGRGLQMIDALAGRWGWDRTRGGKTVWAFLPA